MANKFEPNLAGYISIMNSLGIQARCLSSASAMRDKADSIGSGRYRCDVRPGKKRCHAIVGTTDIVSRRSNAKHNTLRKSIDAGRLG